MATPLADSGGLSPRAFAVQHQRPRASFQGCSRITDYELLGKLGEGTFGYETPQTDSHHTIPTPC